MNVTNNGRINKIDAIDALKGIAFLGIFLLHVKATIEWAALGVCIFFVLSGFLLYIRHKTDEDGFGQGILFALNHIKKVYPLHVVTMLFAVFLEGYNIRLAGGSIRNLLVKIICNIFLIQSWIPNVSVNTSLNGVAWFLSAIIFCYTIFSSLGRKIKQYSSKCLCVCVIIILFLQIFSSFIILTITENENVIRWFTYDAPFFRAGDFAIGAITGKLVTEREQKMKGQKIIIENILLVLLLIMTCAVVVWDTKYPHLTMVSKVLNNWTTIYIPLAAAWVVCFYKEVGCISKIKKCKVLIWIGENSMYLFLIHYIVYLYYRYFLLDTSDWHGIVWLVSVIFIGGFTVFFSFAYKKLKKLICYRWLRYKE